MRYETWVLLGIILTLAACSSDHGQEEPGQAASPSSTIPTAGGRPSTAAPTPHIEVTRCDRVRLPDRGVGEVDFGVNAEEGLLSINFNDSRRGEYRNISYTVRYLDDPSCRTTPDVAVLIDRVRPPRWPLIVLGPRGAGPLRLGMTHQEVARTDAATAPLGSRHDGWKPGCRVMFYRPVTLGRIPGQTTGGQLSPTRGLEQISATQRMITPQGIRIGSTVSALRDAYNRPDVKPGDLVTVPASGRAVYRFLVWRTVTSISLEFEQLDCTR